MFAQILIPTKQDDDELKYLWVAHKAMSKMRKDLCLISPMSYWANVDEIAHLVQRSPPSDYDYLKSPDITQALVDSLSKTSVTWPQGGVNNAPGLAGIQIAEQECTYVVDQIYDAIKRWGNAEAFLAWQNCATLRSAAKMLRLRVIYNEVGPLRPPNFRATAYFDFGGVGKSTQALNRWCSFLSAGAAVHLHELSELVGFFTLKHSNPPSAKNYEVGISLQDSGQEVLSGITNEMMITIVENKFRGPILVRAHPAQKHVPEYSRCDLDNSVSSSIFLERICNIVTVNSGIGFEAMMKGVPVYALGEPSYKFNTWDIDTKKPPCDARVALLWINWFLFCYLIPFELLFDTSYYRWRLSNPSEHEVYDRHYSILTGNRLKFL